MATQLVFYSPLVIDFGVSFFSHAWVLQKVLHGLPGDFLPFLFCFLANAPVLDAAFMLLQWKNLRSVVLCFENDRQISLYKPWKISHLKKPPFAIFGTLQIFWTCSIITWLFAKVSVTLSRLKWCESKQILRFYPWPNRKSLQLYLYTKRGGLANLSVNRF